MKFLRNALLRHLYKAVTVKDLTKGWNSLSKSKREQYKAEAEAILAYEVTGWIKGQMEKEAMRKMYLKSKTEEDMLFSKALLHAESERQELLEQIIKR